MKINKKFYDRFPELDRGIVHLYMLARHYGYDRHFFPPEYHELEKVSLSSAFGLTLDKEWMARWISKWPTPSITMLDYSVSGNTAACVRNMKKFLKDFNQTFGTDLTTEEQCELIDEATDLYLQDQEDKYWEYTKKNSKFIKDNNGSVLEDYIRRISGTNF